MMPYLSDGPAVIIPAADCARYDRLLRDALRFGWLNRRAVPPMALLELADVFHEAAVRYTPQDRLEDRARLATCMTGPTSAPGGRASSASPQEVLLTTTEAAAHLGISAGYVRKLARRSAVETVRTSAGGGGWRFPRAGLDAWAAHRKEIDKRKAA